MKRLSLILCCLFTVSCAHISYTPSESEGIGILGIPVEFLLFLLPTLLGLYGIYRTGAWRGMMFRAYIVLFPFLLSLGRVTTIWKDPLFERHLAILNSTSLAIDVLVAANVTLFLLRRFVPALKTPDIALSFFPLASLCLISPFMAYLWNVVAGNWLF